MLGNASLKALFTCLHICHCYCLQTQIRKLGIYSITVWLVLNLSACSHSEKNIYTPMQQFAALAPQNQTLWLSKVCGVFHESNDFFSSGDIKNAAAAIFEFNLPHLNEQTKPKNTANPRLSVSCTIANLEALADANPNPAQIERLYMRQTLANTFLFTFLGSNEPALALYKQNDAINSLSNMVKTYPVFTEATAQLYDLSLAQKTFAFERKGANNVRAYIAFNLSFDVQEMPLPLGFMSSTKVTVWRSDAPELETFVTNQAFVMPALSSIIVIVGVN